MFRYNLGSLKGRPRYLDKTVEITDTHWGAWKLRA